MLVTFEDYTVYSKEPLTEDEIKKRTKEELESHINRIEESLEIFTDRLKILQDIDLQSLEIKDAGKGQLFKVDIPENDVLLDEQKTFDEQPEKVKEALNKLLKDNMYRIEKSQLKGHEGEYELIKEIQICC